MVRWITNIWQMTVLFGLASLVVVDTRSKIERYLEAEGIANGVTNYFYKLFRSCLDTTMPNQQFFIDNIQSFVNLPSKTTVGVAPKFTRNRKFFAHLITTTAFKEMLAKDEEALRQNLVKKIQFCDAAVMDQNLLQDLYDREVDQSRL